MAVTRFIRGRRARANPFCAGPAGRSRETPGIGRARLAWHPRTLTRTHQTCTQARTGAQVGVRVGLLRSRFPNCCT